MTAARAPGFTMVELLISIALGMVLLTLATTLFLSMRRMVQRNAALLSLHGEAVQAAHIIGDAVTAAHPGGQWRIEASPGDDGAWGTGDRGEGFAITCLTAKPRTVGVGREWAQDRIWARFGWSARGPNGKPCLMFARSDGFREATCSYTDGGSAKSTALRIYPQPRRDRRRDLDDNDLRHLPGISPAVYAALALPGDEADLASQYRPLAGPATRVTRVALGWYDVRGHWTGVDTRTAPAAGIAEYAADGSSVPLLGTAWSGERRVVLDGIRLDGTQTAVAPDAVGSGDRLPTLLTIAFTCSDAVISGDPSAPGAADRALEASFAFSFPASTIIGQF